MTSTELHQTGFRPENQGFETENQGFQPENQGFKPVPSGAFSNPGSATAQSTIDFDYVAAFVKGSTQAASTGYTQGYEYGLKSKSGWTQPPPAVSVGFIDQNESRAFGEGYAHGFSGGFAAGYAQGAAKAEEQGSNGGFVENHGFKPEENQGFKPQSENNGF